MWDSRMHNMCISFFLLLIRFGPVWHLLRKTTTLTPAIWKKWYTAWCSHWKFHYQHFRLFLSPWVECRGFGKTWLSVMLNATIWLPDDTGKKRTSEFGCAIQEMNDNYPCIINPVNYQRHTCVWESHQTGSIWKYSLQDETGLPLIPNHQG